MENASKALIIAGAILLAIVIISLGLIVVNNVRDTVDNTNLSEQEIASFNAKFTGYEGTNVSGSRVNTLIQQVIASNQATYNEGKNNFICIGFESNGTGDYYFICLRKNNGTLVSSMKKTEDEFNSVSILGSGGIREKLIGNTDNNSVNVPLSVATGKNYTISIEYEKSLVQAIKVK